METEFLWSPDGEQLSYVVVTPLKHEWRTIDGIYVMKSDGTEKRKISPEMATISTPYGLPMASGSFFYVRIDVATQPSFGS